MEKVAGYIRVSSQEQKLHGYSLEAQKMKLHEYAKKHGMEIVKIYADEGVSGRKLIKNRPALQKMIQAAEQKEFDRIIFIKLDRFFRSVAEYHECMKRISPVTWTTTEEDYDLTTANGRMLVNMKLTIAELEADQTGERIRITNEYKVKQGAPLTGKLPWCYIIAKTPDGKRIIKNPETEPAMNDMISYYMTHQSTTDTMRYMAERHGINMSMESINRLLKNPLIYGMYRGNPNYAEPYIDKATFDRIQTIIPHPVKHNSDNFFYFSGLIRCPECGCVMAGTTVRRQRLNGSKMYKYYKCNKSALTLKCGNRFMINEVDIESMMIDRIEPILRRSKKLYAASTHSGAAGKMSKLQAELERLNYGWQKGRIGVEDYDREFMRLNRQIKGLQDNETAPDYKRIDDILNKDWKEVYQGLSDESKRAFWRSFAKEIHVTWNSDIHEIKEVLFL